MKNRGYRQIHNDKVAGINLNMLIIILKVNGLSEIFFPTVFTSCLHMSLNESTTGYQSQLGQITLFFWTLVSLSFENI